MFESGSELVQHVEEGLHGVVYGGVIEELVSPLAVQMQLLSVDPTATRHLCLYVGARATGHQPAATQTTYQPPCLSYAVKYSRTRIKETRI